MDFKKLVKRKKLTDYLIYGIVILAGIIADQVTKLIAVKYLQPIEDVPVIKFGDTEVFNFTYVENSGAAFGMLKDAPWVFNTISIVAVIAMLAYLFLGHSNSRLEAIAIGMMIAGGIGNMIDRICLKYVVDFLYFKLINFAVFNVADSFVCVGAGLLILAAILDICKEVRKNKEKQEEKAKNTTPCEETDTTEEE